MIDAPDWTPRERSLAQMVLTLRDRLNNPTPRPTRLYSLEVTKVIRPTDQAFPAPHGDSGTQGMSIREWLAGQALAGVVARSSLHVGTEALAEEAVRIADAVIRRLNQNGMPAPDMGDMLGVR